LMEEMSKIERAGHIINPPRSPLRRKVGDWRRPHHQLASTLLPLSSPSAVVGVNLSRWLRGPRSLAVRVVGDGRDFVGLSGVPDSEVARMTLMDPHYQMVLGCPGTDEDSGFREIEIGHILDLSALTSLWPISKLRSPQGGPSALK